jgi:beta-N-acetylhexosaminidase
MQFTNDLDAKIGPMILVGFRGLELTSTSPVVKDIREHNLGGVILFDYDVPTASSLRNIHSPQQVKALTDTLQRTASTRLFISIDQEGGEVARLKEKAGFPTSVSQQYLGSLNHLDTTRQFAETTAKTLAQLGINLNLAPVVDLNLNPDNPVMGRRERSFSADPAIVTVHARQVIGAHRRHGVLTTLKHFPGHGSSRADSHVGFVDVTNTWSRIELEPYADIIRAGESDAVMTAHIFNAKLDPTMPATLSRPILTGILRNELHYDGVIISDDMQMKAISAQYGFEAAIQFALDAGVDILTFANNLNYDEIITTRAIRVIQQLVEDGKISPDRIDESYQRIRRLKARLTF